MMNSVSSGTVLGPVFEKVSHWMISHRSAHISPLGDILAVVEGMKAAKTFALLEICCEGESLLSGIWHGRTQSGCSRAI